MKEFAKAAQAFCSRARSPVQQHEQEAAVALQHIATLFAAGCAPGWAGGEPADFDPPGPGVDLVRAKAVALPFQRYSEVFKNLVVPPEQPVVGDLVDDLEDIYPGIALGLDPFDAGEIEEARNHWQFWFAGHRGEHATSAARALRSYLAEREGADLQRHAA